jgi:hypothetical protein
MFNGIWLVALEPLTIQGREVKAGERFHISRVHSGALLVQKRATILHPQPPPKNKAMVAEAPEPPPAPKRRGRQRKTDVAAEVTTEVKTGIAPTAPTFHHAGIVAAISRLTSEPVRAHDYPHESASRFDVA